MAHVSLLKNEKPAVRRAGRGQNHSRGGLVDEVTGVKQLFGPAAIGSLPEQRPPVRAGSVNEALAVRCPERRGRSLAGFGESDLPCGVLPQVQNPDVRLSQRIADCHGDAFTVWAKTWVGI